MPNNKITKRKGTSRKQGAPSHIERASVIGSDEALSANVMDLIRLDYAAFMKRLGDEALKKSNGITITEQDLDDVLLDVLREFRG